MMEQEVSTLVCNLYRYSIHITVLVSDTDEMLVCTLEKVLFFFTGAEEIPPLGYEVPATQVPCLSFSHSAVYPTASTCTIELTLPTKYFQDPYRVFREVMYTAMLCHGGFGLI